MRIDRERELLGKPADASGGSVNIEAGPKSRTRPTYVRFRAQRDVLGHGHRVHEHEVLMDHADAERNGIERALNVSRLSVDDNLAAVGCIEAVGDAHGGRLPRSVLANDGVNRAGLDRDVDVVVREDAAEPLSDVSELNH